MLSISFVVTTVSAIIIVATATIIPEPERGAVTVCPPLCLHQGTLDILGPSEVDCPGVGQVVGGPCQLGPHKAVAREIPTPQPHSQVLCLCACLYVSVYIG